MMCREHINQHEGPVLVVTGDSPMIQVDSVNALLKLYADEKPACILGSLNSDDPHGLGRIVRNNAGEFVGIVEEKDATDEQRKITEVNMSTYVFDAAELRTTLDKLTNDNQQNEYYITDCPGILREENTRSGVVSANSIASRAAAIRASCSARSRSWNSSI